MRTLHVGKKITARLIAVPCLMSCLAFYSGAALPLAAIPWLRTMPLPRIRVLATGGTITGVEASKESPSYSSGIVTAENLIRSVPQLADVAEVSVEQISNIGSQTMNDGIWIRLARRLNEVLEDTRVDGVVITHGTDTLEETAYFLSLVVKSDKPIVMVGATRPATALSADGPMIQLCLPWPLRRHATSPRGAQCG